MIQAVSTWRNRVGGLLGHRWPQVERRREGRTDPGPVLNLIWKDDDSKTHQAEVETIDCSAEGYSFLSPERIIVGRSVGVRFGQGICRGVVRHCAIRGEGFLIGVELQEAYEIPFERPSAADCSPTELKSQGA